MLAIQFTSNTWICCSRRVTNKKRTSITGQISYDAEEKEGKYVLIRMIYQNTYIYILFI